MSQDEMRQRIKDEAESHPDTCNCTTCRAAGGDEEAMRELLKELL